MPEITRVIVVQGPNQLVDALAVLRYQEAIGAYQHCKDILVLGGYVENTNMTAVCLQISQIWDFKDRIVLHGYETLCADNNVDFDGAANLLKRVINCPDVDVLYTMRNWQFINEIFLYTYPNAHKICYGELGRLDVSAINFSHLYGVKPFNPSGRYLDVDEAYLVLVPINVEDAFDHCPVTVIDSTFYQSVIYDSAKQIQGLQEYCQQIQELFGDSITLFLTSYDTEFGFTKSLDDEINGYLEIIEQHTIPGSNILIKGHPRHQFHQAEILANELIEQGYNVSLVPDFFSRVLSELFIPYLNLARVITPTSSSCISLAYLSNFEIVIGLGKTLTYKYINPRYHNLRLFGEYYRTLLALKARQQDFTSVNYDGLERSFSGNENSLISNLLQTYPSQFLEYQERYILLSETDVQLKRQLMHSSVLSDNIQSLLNSSTWITQIQNYVEQFYLDSSNLENINQLRKIRIEIASSLLQISEDHLNSLYSSNFSDAYEILLNSGIQSLPLNESEQQFIDELKLSITPSLDKSKAIQCLLASMLFNDAQLLPYPCDLSQIPEWCLYDYLKFIFRQPSVFKEIGEINNYTQYLEQWINYIYEETVSSPDSPVWSHVIDCMTRYAQFVPFYFTDKNLKNLYIKRANILELYLLNKGYEIDYNFSLTSRNTNKIRVGILAWYYTPKTESFATLPIYKYLNRDVFEIILFTLEITNNRLERYCAGHADGMVELPSSLSEQVQTIRNTELDILFISTNVTAVTNPITLLALHRLARIQIVDANSPVTTGMRHIDYYLSSQLSEPQNNAQDSYTEKLIELDCPPQCFDFATESQILPTINISRDRLGISKDTVVYISGANFYKITPELEATWANIISQVDNSILLLYPFNPNWSPSYPLKAFKERLSKSFSQRGISDNRLILLEVVPHRIDIKERLKIADIYLDSYPYSGMTSLIDPLEVGLPTVVQEGKSSRSKKGASLLRELQMTHLIADSEDSYIKIAVNLGKNQQQRLQTHLEIKQKMQEKPVFVNSYIYGNKISEIFKNIDYNYWSDFFKDALKLRDTNLIIFPDWNQPEDILYPDLMKTLQGFMAHYNQENITLLINTTGTDEESANFMISDITLNLLMEGNSDLEEELQISWVGDFNLRQKSILLNHIQGRICMTYENQIAISQWKADDLPVFSLN